MKTLGLMAFALFVLLGNGAGAQPAVLLSNWQASGQDNVEVERLAGDSLSTSFLISVRKNVATHCHAYHSEHVYVLEAQGLMWLEADTFRIGAGHYVFIPAGTPHGVEVEGTTPLKVLSIQSPEFVGRDRIVVKP